jgi:hypothetical protein
MTEKGATDRRLVVVALAFVVAWIVVALTQLIRPSAIEGLFPVILSFAAIFCGVVVLGRKPFAEPIRFDVREGVAFVVPGNRAYGYQMCAQILMFGVIMGQPVVFWDRSRGFAHVVAVGMWVIGALLSVLIATAVLRVLRQRPILEFTPAALVVRDVLGTRTIPWEVLRPGFPTRSTGTLRLVIDRPALVRCTGLMWRSTGIAVMYTRVHPWFLADAIRYYVEHPDRRAGIGTVAEYHRLRVDLGVTDEPRTQLTDAPRT